MGRQFSTDPNFRDPRDHQDSDFTPRRARVLRESVEPLTEDPPIDSAQGPLCISGQTLFELDQGVFDIEFHPISSESYGESGYDEDTEYDVSSISQFLYTSDPQDGFTPTTHVPLPDALRRTGFVYYPEDGWVLQLPSGSSIPRAWRTHTVHRWLTQVSAIIGRLRSQGLRLFDNSFVLHIPLRRDVYQVVFFTTHSPHTGDIRLNGQFLAHLGRQSQTFSDLVSETGRRAHRYTNREISRVYSQYAPELRIERHNLYAFAGTDERDVVPDLVGTRSSSPDPWIAAGLARTTTITASGGRIRGVRYADDAVAVLSTSQEVDSFTANVAIVEAVRAFAPEYTPVVDDDPLRIRRSLTRALPQALREHLRSRSDAEILELNSFFSIFARVRR